MAFRCDRCNLMFGDDEKNEVIVHKLGVPFRTDHCNACRAQISTFANSDCIGIIEPGESGCEAVNELRVRRHKRAPLARVLEIVEAAQRQWYGFDAAYECAEEIVRTLLEEFEQDTKGAGDNDASI